MRNTRATHAHRTNLFWSTDRLSDRIHVDSNRPMIVTQTTMNPDKWVLFFLYMFYFSHFIKKKCVWCINIALNRRCLDIWISTKIEQSIVAQLVSSWGRTPLKNGQFYFCKITIPIASTSKQTTKQKKLRPWKWIAIEKMARTKMKNESCDISLNRSQCRWNVSRSFKF